MHLLILFILFVILGYLLANNRTVKKAEEVSSGWLDQTHRWVAGLFGNEQLTFRQWALDPASEHFTKDFRQWLSGLNPQEAVDFEKSLSKHLAASAEPLASISLEKVKSGELDQDPAVMKIFVEAVTVYSREYRKAHKAQSESKKQEENKEAPPVVEEKAVAEKQPSRRRSASQSAVGD